MRETRGGFGTVLLFGFVIYALMHPAHAQAQPACEHRSAEHAAQAHTTREGDSRWHVLHGQLPTCGLDQSDDDRDKGHGDEGSPRPHRDHPGFHCTIHGCG